MAVNLSPVGGVAGQFFDNNGNPLTGGKIYTYSAGTSTNLATYTSTAGVTAHTNPIILDAGGRVPGGEIWLTDGLQYKFVLKNSVDTLIGTYDNIIGINSNFINFLAQEEIQTATAGQTVFTLATVNYQPGTNSLSVFVDGVNQYDGSSYSYVETDGTTVTFTAGLHVGALVKFTTAQSLSSGATDASIVTYTPAGTGAVSTTVQAKLRESVSVLDFGAATTNTATQNSTAIQAAMDAADDVLIPPGTYAIDALLYKRNYQVLRGSGFGNTVLNSTVSGVGASVIKNTDAATTLIGCELRDLRINATSLATGFVVNWNHIQLGRLERVWAVGGGNNCIGFSLGATWTVTEATYNTFIGCYTGGVLKGFALGDGANSNIFINCRAQPAYAGGYGFFFFGTGAGRISSNTIVGGGSEYPGAISGGIYLGVGSDSTTINGFRNESMDIGVDIQAATTNTTLIGGYYDSCSTNVSDAGTGTTIVEQGSVTGAGVVLDPDYRCAVFNGIAGTFTSGIGVTTITKNGTGDYTIPFTVNLKNSIPIVTIEATTAYQKQIFTVDNTGLRIKLYDSANAAVDSGYVCVTALAF